MVVNKIEETNQGVGAQEIRGKNPMGKKCLYYERVGCKVPKQIMKICKNCPRMARFVQTNEVHSLFDHIKAFAISLLEKMNIQLSSK